MHSAMVGLTVAALRRRPRRLAPPAASSARCSEADSAQPCSPRRTSQWLIHGRAEPIGDKGHDTATNRHSGLSAA